MTARRRIVGRGFVIADLDGPAKRVTGRPPGCLWGLGRTREFRRELLPIVSAYRKWFLLSTSRDPGGSGLRSGRVDCRTTARASDVAVEGRSGRKPLPTPLAFVMVSVGVGARKGRASEQPAEIAVIVGNSNDGPRCGESGRSLSASVVAGVRIVPCAAWRCVMRGGGKGRRGRPCAGRGAAS